MHVLDSSGILLVAVGALTDLLVSNVTALLQKAPSTEFKVF